jgi:hypothetical protein
MRALLVFTAAAVTFCGATGASAQDADDLAKQLSNPIASLISVPIQFNVDFGAGPGGDGESYLLNVQPVVPINLNADWNMISRTIVPVRFQDDIFAEDVFGLGDITQSIFFSPTQPGPGGLVWGIGPVFLLPTATDELLGSEKWGAGPTAVALVQRGQWTVGALANHIWSFAGDEDRADVSQTFLQPFVSYALGGGQTLSVNLESGYDWNADQWTVPLNVGYSKVFQAGGQLMSWQVGAKAYLVSPDNGPDWGLRSTLTFLFPSQ